MALLADPLYGVAHQHNYLLAATRLVDCCSVRDCLCTRKAVFACSCNRMPTVTSPMAVEVRLVHRLTVGICSEQSRPALRSAVARRFRWKQTSVSHRTASHPPIVKLRHNTVLTLLVYHCVWPASVIFTADPHTAQLTLIIS